jgi:hypothetical protein
MRLSRHDGRLDKLAPDHRPDTLSPQAPFPCSTAPRGTREQTPTPPPRCTPPPWFGLSDGDADPVKLFAILVEAHRRRDVRAAAEATRALRRLRWSVVPLSPLGEGGDDR